MDNQTKVILALLAIIVILVGIFVLKVTGVIKPAERKIENIETSIDKKTDNNNYEYKESTRRKVLNFISKLTVLFRIIIFIINIIINIGIGKLYRKLSMPDWCITMQYIAPLLNITSAIPLIGGIISLIIAILEILTLSYYFYSVGMSKLWPLCPIISLLICAIGFSLSAGLFEASSGGGNSDSLFLFLAYGLTIVFVVAYLIANVKVGLMLNRGTIFIIGLVLLPFIFQPILGFIRDYKGYKGVHDFIDEENTIE